MLTRLVYQATGYEVHVFVLSGVLGIEVHCDTAPALLSSYLCSKLNDDANALWSVASLIQQKVDGHKGCNGDVATYLTHLQMILP